MKRLSWFLLIWLAAPSGAQAAEITVSAAASLKEAFAEIAAGYQRRYPEATIRLNTAASGVLVRQLAQGAPVDVIATADEAVMDQAAARRLIVPDSRRIFARNRLVLAVPSKAVPPPDLAALRQPSIRRIAIGRPQSVPAGTYAQAALQRAGLYDRLAPKFVHTQNVRQALDYVARGEADAAFVYRTDALRQPQRLRIAFTVDTGPVRYPIAVGAASPQQWEARRFVSHVLSQEGQAVLRRHGFEAP